MGRVVLVSVLLLGWLCAPAQAGRTPFGWLEDVETQPERGAEIEMWFGELNQWHRDIFDTREDWSFVGWAAALGITDRLELRIPLEMVSSVGHGGGARLHNYGLEGRWRLASSDPLEAPAVVPLVRLRAQRMVGAGRIYRLQPGAVVSADLGRVRFTADASVSVDFDASRTDEVLFSFHPFVGVSVATVDKLRVGAEVGGILTPGAFERGYGAAEPWFGFGPNLAWSHGRTWLSGALIKGTAHAVWAPRINLGIAF